MSFKDSCYLRVAQPPVVEPHIGQAAAEGADLAVADVQRLYRFHLNWFDVLIQSCKWLGMWFLPAGRIVP